MVDVQQDGGGMLLLQNLDAGQPFRFRCHGKVDNVPLNVTFVKCLDLCQFLGSALYFLYRLFPIGGGTAARFRCGPPDYRVRGLRAASGERATGVRRSCAGRRTQVMEENP